MKRTNFFVAAALLSLSCVAARAQAPIDPLASISADLSSISKSVEMLTKQLKAFVDKWEKVGGLTLSEKQQNLIMGLELLMRAEQRLATLQKTQIELAEKQGPTRARLAQVERDLYPQSIDRSVAFEGTTRTEEMRESRRNTLIAERATLQALLSQINSTLSETAEGVRDAQALVNRLRRTFLPQIERELADQQ
jgi:chromosome segregation ATPase